MKTACMTFALLLALVALAPAAGAVQIDLAPDPANPAVPQMGDHLQFHSVIRNDGQAPATGIVAWISLVQTDKGREQPMDLEDWSAHKAVVIQRLMPGQTLDSAWNMRLIQSGSYRVVISAMARNGATLASSPFVDFAVRQKPVVESGRVLPVALGVPLLLAGLMLLRLLRGRREP